MASRVRVRVALSLLVTLLALGLLLRGVRLDAIAIAMRGFSWSRVPIALGFYAATLALRAERVRRLLRTPISYGRVLLVVGASHLASVALPFHVGVLVGPYLLATVQEVPLGEGVAVAFAERVLDALMLLVLTLLAAWLFDGSALALLATARHAVIGASSIALVTSLLVAIAGLRGALVIARIARRALSPRFACPLVRFVARFARVVHGLGSRPRAAAWAIATTALWWTTSMGAAATVMGGLDGLPAPSARSLALNQVAIVTGGVVFPTPGHVGGFEAGAFAAMTSLGARAETATAFALVLHTLQLGFTIAVGLACFASVGRRRDAVRSERA
jgi:uncharacterized membrane protein YbhN (UPF0104 family)